MRMQKSNERNHKPVGKEELPVNALLRATASALEYLPVFILGV